MKKVCVTVGGTIRRTQEIIVTREIIMLVPVDLDVSTLNDVLDREQLNESFLEGGYSDAFDEDAWNEVNVWEEENELTPDDEPLEVSEDVSGEPELMMDEDGNIEDIEPITTFIMTDGTEIEIVQPVEVGDDPKPKAPWEKEGF